ncbi:MAG TPA: MFS transporter [Jatrophihabitans sp.]|nr:MFS transporter [Jatrophihabitans sp.]
MTSQISEGSRPAAEPEEAADPHRWKALAVCLAGGFMVLLDISIVNVALPSMAHGLHASGDQIQWVLSGYSLTFGLLLVPAGRLGDARGRRRLWMLGLEGFTAASVLCGAAPNADWLVIARLVQGLAAGLLTPQISALIQQLFRGRERAKAFGLFGATVGVSTALGPVVGGLLIQLFGQADGWRWVFFVNLPIGVLVLPFAFRLLPAAAGPQRSSQSDLDPVGVLLLGVGIVVLLLPFVQEQQWKGSGKWLLVPVALLLLLVFLGWEVRYRRRGKEPVIDLALFAERSFSFGSSMITVFFAGFTSLFFVLTLMLQFGRGYSALLAGVTTLPFALASGAAAGIAGRVVHRFGRKLLVFGLVLATLGFLGVIGAVAWAPVHAVGWALIVPLVAGGAGSGMVISPNQALTLSEVPVHRAGTAGGLIQVGQRIGSAVGIAAVGSVFFARLSATRGDYASALERGLVVAVAFLVAALLLTVVEERVLRPRRQLAQSESLPQR